MRGIIKIVFFFLYTFVVTQYFRFFLGKLPKQITPIFSSTMINRYYDSNIFSFIFITSLSARLVVFFFSRAFLGFCLIVLFLFLAFHRQHQVSFVHLLNPLAFSIPLTKPLTVGNPFRWNNTFAVYNSQQILSIYYSFPFFSIRSATSGIFYSSTEPTGFFNSFDQAANGW